MPELDITQDEKSRRVVFKDPRILHESYAREIGMELMKIAADIADKGDDQAIILNFRQVQFMASAMIGQVILLRNKCKERGIAMKVCCLSKELAETIHLMNLDKIIDVFDSEQSAMDSIMPAG